MSALRPTRLGKPRVVLAALLAVFVAAGCGGGSDLPQGSEPVDLNPADFSVEIDNPYWPMKPGSRWCTGSATAKAGCSGSS